MPRTLEDGCLLAKTSGFLVGIVALGVILTTLLTPLLVRWQRARPFASVTRPICAQHKLRLRRPRA